MDTKPDISADYYDAIGTNNVVGRIAYICGPDKGSLTDIAKDWECARSQGYRYLTQECENTMVRWAMRRAGRL